MPEGVATPTLELPVDTGKVHTTPAVLAEEQNLLGLVDLYPGVCGPALAGCGALRRL